MKRVHRTAGKGGIGPAGEDAARMPAARAADSQDATAVEGAATKALSEKMRRLGAHHAPPGLRGVNGLEKIEALLKPDDRAGYEALLGRPETSPRVALAWLRERGYPVGLKAVSTHRRQFRETLRGLRNAARFAVTLRSMFESHGPGFVSDVALVKIEQHLMQRLFAEDDKGQSIPLPIDELKDLARLTADAISSRGKAEQLRREFEQKGRKAVEEAEKGARAGFDGKAIADRVREVLGIPLGDDPEL